MALGSPCKNSLLWKLRNNKSNNISNAMQTTTFFDFDETSTVNAKRSGPIIKKNDIIQHPGLAI